jgi:nucleoside-diphosphate-sugar epimerase
VALSPVAVGEVINIGSGVGVTIGEVAGLIQDLIGRRVEIETDEQRVRPPASEVMRLVCGNDKAFRLTGWRPQTALRDGLAQTIDHIERHPDQCKTAIYNI